MPADAKRQLVDFLIDHSFEPVMKARPDGRSEAEKRKLDHVQEATRKEIDRYHGYDSARDVVVNFRRDLNSHAAEKVHAELRDLDLPTINDIRDEFEAKVRDLHVDT
ncbi:hypothetical protein [Inquilinus sp. CAU 1745]|uniref:hypothetical protein n=1 Tax=Inquilinus sp. CAU 1745 TaxID=3140369 RepID=UPI00325A7BB5